MKTLPNRNMHTLKKQKYFLKEKILKANTLMKKMFFTHSEGNTNQKHITPIKLAENVTFKISSVVKDNKAVRTLSDAGKIHWHNHQTWSI